MYTPFDLHIAQISDIHINRNGNHHDVLGGEAANILRRVVAELNQIEDLNFVIVSGDMADNGWPSELDEFDEIMSDLRVRHFIIPGNHDRSAPDDPRGLSRYQLARRYNPQIEHRPTDGVAQAGYWVHLLRNRLLLVGLDTIQDGVSGGYVDNPQLAWLVDTLEQHSHLPTIIVSHHPFHKLAPIDDDPKWADIFLCHNRAAVNALLDQHRSVRLVLTGHHHVTKADRSEHRLSLACPSTSIYPCAYRTVRVSVRPKQDVSDRKEVLHVRWQTHSAVAPDLLTQAEQMKLTTWREFGFDDEFITIHSEVAWGSPYDRAGEA